MARTEDRAREVRLRRGAERQGLVLHKSRTRDPKALDYGTYVLRDADTRRQLSSNLSLDQVEKFLTER